MKDHMSCDVCDNLFTIEDDGVAHHLTKDDEIDYNLDADHVPYTLEDYQTAAIEENIDPHHVIDYPDSEER